MTGGPVLLGGVSFSGKTPLGIALDAHPRIAVSRHTAMWRRFLGRFGDLERPANLERCLDAMLADVDVARLQADRSRLERELSNGGRLTYVRLFSLFHEQHAERVGKPRWADQMGLLERHADLILTSDPSAQMIHMVRGPLSRARVAARVSGRRPTTVARQAARWAHSARLARRNARRYPGRYLVMHYEDLDSGPEPALRRVADFLHEDYCDAMAAAAAAVGEDHATTRTRRS